MKEREMRGVIICCITAVLITVIHDIVGPSLQLDAQLEVAAALERIQKRAADAGKPSIEIIPGPQFRVKPEFRKDRL